MAAAGIKDSSGDVVMDEVNGVVIEPPEDADQETKDLWQQHRELKKKLPVYHLEKDGSKVRFNAVEHGASRDILEGRLKNQGQPALEWDPPQHDPEWS